MPYTRRQVAKRSFADTAAVSRPARALASGETVTGYPGEITEFTQCFTPLYSVGVTRTYAVSLYVIAAAGMSTTAIITLDLPEFQALPLVDIPVGGGIGYGFGGDVITTIANVISGTASVQFILQRAGPAPPGAGFGAGDQAMVLIMFNTDGTIPGNVS